MLACSGRRNAYAFASRFWKRWCFRSTVSATLVLSAHGFGDACFSVLWFRIYLSPMIQWCLCFCFYSCGKWGESTLINLLESLQNGESKIGWIYGWGVLTCGRWFAFEFETWDVRVSSWTMILMVVLSWSMGRWFSIYLRNHKTSRDNFNVNKFSHFMVYNSYSKTFPQIVLQKRENSFWSFFRVSQSSAISFYNRCWLLLLSLYISASRLRVCKNGEQTNQ
jgi:hypothetical protein